MPPEPPPPPPPPYDARVEYIESSGTQFIDTGIIITGPFTCELLAEFYVNNPSFAKLMGYGNNSSAAYQYCRAQVSGANGSIIFHHGAGGSFDLSIEVDSTRVIHSITIANDGSSDSFFSVDGVIRDIVDPIGDKVSAGSVFLFAMNSCLNRSGEEIPSSAVAFSKFRLHGFTFTMNGNVIRDFIPVRINDVGCLYDRVEGIIYENQGSGQFAVGPDVVSLHD